MSRLSSGRIKDRTRETAEIEPTGETFFIKIVSVTYKLKLIDSDKEFEFPVKISLFSLTEHISVFF